MLGIGDGSNGNDRHSAALREAKHLGRFLRRKHQLPTAPREACWTFPADNLPQDIQPYFPSTARHLARSPRNQLVAAASWGSTSGANAQRNRSRALSRGR